MAVIKSESEIRRMIYIVRNQQVMLDSDLASLYHVETKRLNERVKRNRNLPIKTYKLLTIKLLYSMFLINYYIGAFVWK